jgi:flagellar protein FliO/FliZ
VWDDGMSAWNDVKLILSLLFILALAYACIRLLGRRSAGFSRQRVVRVVTALPLGGANRTLQVVVVDEKTVLLLGVGANIECVGRFDDPDLARRLLEQTVSASALPFTPTAISKLVSRLKGRPQNAGTDKGSRARGPDFAKVLSVRLAEAMERREGAVQSFENGQAERDVSDGQAVKAGTDGGEPREGGPFLGR